jgi:hypothetical protein
MQPKYRAVLPLLAFVLLAGPSGAHAAARPEDKVMPWVMEKTAGGATAEFLVLLTAQTDLSPAKLLATKSAKGWFVRNALWETAQATQGPLLAELEARSVEHRAYYIVNMVWVKGDRSLVLDLAARPDVAAIEGNPVIHNDLPQEQRAGEGSCPPNGVETGVAYVRAPEVWAMGFTGQGVVVGEHGWSTEWASDTGGSRRGRRVACLRTTWGSGRRCRRSRCSSPSGRMRAGRRSARRSSSAR